MGTKLTHKRPLVVEVPQRPRPVHPEAFPPPLWGLLRQPPRRLGEGLDRPSPLGGELDPLHVGWPIGEGRFLRPVAGATGERGGDGGEEGGNKQADGKHRWWEGRDKSVGGWEGRVGQIGF